MILAIDTATDTASIALYDPVAQLLVAEETWQARRRQTEALVPALQAMMERVGMARTDLQTIAVTTGPGSFTGVRIGISLVKGIALGLPRLPRLVGIPTLSATAAPWLEVGQHLPDLEIWAFIQAGRGRYNWAIFQPGDLLQRPALADYGVGKADRLEAELVAHDHPIWLVGEITQAVSQFARRKSNLYLVDSVSGLRRAGQVARLAALYLDAGYVETVDTLQPLYLQELV